MTTIKIIVRRKGGPGSGNWGHAGRPGLQGGSVPRGHTMSLRSGRDWLQRYQAASGKPHADAELASAYKKSEDESKSSSKFLLDRASEVKAGKYGRGYFLRPDGKLVDVTQEFGGGTNDHPGFIVASEHPELVGLTKDKVAKFREYGDKLYGKSGEEFNAKYQDAFDDAYEKLWHNISNAGMVRVREFDIRGRQAVAVDYFYRNVTKSDLRRLQDNLLNGKIPDTSKRGGDYSIDSMNFSAAGLTWKQIMEANNWRDLE